MPSWVCSLFRFSILISVLSGLAGCAITTKAPAPTWAGSNAVVRYALSLQGVPYVWGKDSPREGFDCSGFVKHVYEKHGVKLPRTVREMVAELPEVPKDRRRPGDLLFFRTEGRFPSHVGIYVGGESFVHAPSRRSGRVMVSNLRQPYWWQHFLAVRRVWTEWSKPVDAVANADFVPRKRREYR
jgi:cell wall-associated NlpC family hydrolase